MTADERRRTRAAAWALAGLLLGPVRAQPIEYLSDCPERFGPTQQAWGTLGYDVAAHAPDKAGQPLQIGTHAFAKGLGHHAPGTIHVLLDGEFDRFEAQVGLQPCAGGSVAFRVLVDGAVRFESGVMKSGDPPKPVVVPLAGAQELVLEVSDAGDGITCDTANWAEARLHRSGPSQPRRMDETVDMAPFGRVIAGHPLRPQGTRANRLEEFPAEDLSLDRDLVEVEGRFPVPVGTNQLACIGLQWPNRRALRELELEFADATRRPETNGVRVEAWFGESAWQGEWQPLAGTLEASEARLRFQASPKAPTGGLLLTRKVRWIWPATAGPVWVKRPMAFTRSRWGTTRLLVEWERSRDLRLGRRPSPAAAAGAIEVANGRLIEPETIRRDERQPQAFTVRYSLPSTLYSDPTLLRIHSDRGLGTVAVSDILTNEAVYVPHLGVLFCRADAPVRLAEYKRRIAGRKTILESVRSMPDQTVERAMAITHHDAQREGPVMLSLAGDNRKVVVERDGTVRFSTAPALKPEWLGTASLLRPDFGAGGVAGRTRHLDGGWLPIPVITVAQTNVVWRQRTFVAPVSDAPLDPARRYTPRRSVTVVEFSATNTAAEPSAARLDLRLSLDPQDPKSGAFTRCEGGYSIRRADQPIGRALTDAAEPLAASPDGSSLVVHGTLPPHSAVAFGLFLPSEPDDLLKLPTAAQLRRQTESYWDSLLASATRIETPSAFLNDLVRSSQVRCLIAARNEADGERIAPWIAAMSYGPLESEAHAVIRGMDYLGHTEFARRGLDYFIHRYNTNGFLTTGYTTFGTAWHLWTLGEHDQLHRDPEWLDGVRPELTRVGNWIVRQTEKTRVYGTDGVTRMAGFGLMPPGVMADWNAFACHFCLNAYYAAALRSVGDALAQRGEPEGARFRLAAHLLAEETVQGWLETARQSAMVPLRNGTWVGYYPSQRHSPGKLGDFFPGEDAGRSWCYDVELGAHQLVPAGLLAPHDVRVTWMLDHMEDVQFLADGWFDYPAVQNAQDWFNLGGFSKVQPYYTRNGEIYALRDDVKPFVRSYFNTLAAMVNPEVLTMWEHFHHSGAWDKTHETGYFLHQTRTMLVTERGDELWLAPLMTSNWLKDGDVVQVSHAPTRFGPVSFRLESHVAQNRITATIDPPRRQVPQSIVLRVRHPETKPIRSVYANGRRHRALVRDQDTIRLPADRGPLTVEVRY